MFWSLGYNIYITTKSPLSKVNYRKELRIGFEIIKKKKYVKAEKFVKELKKIYKKAKIELKKSQEEMKKNK